MNFPHKLLVEHTDFKGLVVNDIHTLATKQLKDAEAVLFIISMDHVLGDFSSNDLIFACSEFDRKRIGSYLRQEQRDLYIAAQNCVFTVLRKLGLERFWFRTPDCGRPYINCKGVEISISHDSDYLVIALSSSGRIGVDIETQEAALLLRMIGLRYDFEFGLEERFGPIQHWTFRESILKAFNLNMSEMMGGLSIKTMDTNFEISSARNLFGHWTVTWLPFSTSTVCIFKENLIGSSS